MYKDVVILICKDLDILNISNFLSVDKKINKYSNNEDLFIILWNRDYPGLNYYNVYGDNSTYFEAYKTLHKFKIAIGKYLLNYNERFLKEESKLLRKENFKNFKLSELYLTDPLMSNLGKYMFKKLKNRAMFVPSIELNTPIASFYGDVLFNISDKSYANQIYLCINHNEIDGPFYEAFRTELFSNLRKKFNKDYYENFISMTSKPAWL